MFTVWNSGSPEYDPYICKQNCNVRSSRGIEEEKLLFWLRNAKDFKTIIFSLLVIEFLWVSKASTLDLQVLWKSDLSCKSE